MKDRAPKLAPTLRPGMNGEMQMGGGATPLIATPEYVNEKAPVSN